MMQALPRTGAHPRTPGLRWSGVRSDSMGPVDGPEYARGCATACPKEIPLRSIAAMNKEWLRARLGRR